jgi:ribosomal protein S27AE
MVFFLSFAYLLTTPLQHPTRPATSYFLQASSSRTVAPSVTTTSRTSPPSIWSSVSAATPRSAKRRPTTSVLFPALALVRLSSSHLVQTPKKIKHKRKKVKIAILKYYKVENDGKIKRLRRECPTAERGAGIFVSQLSVHVCVGLLFIAAHQMAFRNDRQYCGKCGLTYTFQPGTKPPV